MPKDKKLTKEDAEKAAKALEVLFSTDYVSKRNLYKENFIRGIFFSVGSIIGAAVIVGLIIWVLSFFDSVPIINNVKESIQSTQQQ